MKLSLVFELLLIFVLLAFAASKSVRNRNGVKKVIHKRNDGGDKVEESTINKYCKCAEAYCNCCREFTLPYVSLDGPGCASLMYLNGDKMSVSLSFGRKVITNKTLSSRKPSPVCMPLPGGISKFCGRVYNIARSGEEFRACLGLELQTRKTVEAAVRVSCFKFGPRGVHAEPADPLPLVPQDEKGGDDDDEDDDDDDDDDDFGLGGDEDDDDADLDGINDVDSADYTGFSILGEDLLGDLFGSSGSKKPNKNRKKQAPAQSTTATTKKPRPSRRPTRKPSSRVTTPRTTLKTSTVKVRPVNRRTRRPTRKPNRRRPTTSLATESTLSSTLSTTTTTQMTPLVTSASTISEQTTRGIQYISTAQEDTYEPVVIVTQKPVSTLSVTTPKPTTDFEDSGLEMSLQRITGQLSVMPQSTIISDSAKESSMMTTSHDISGYEKVETFTPKGTTVPFATTLEDSVNDDMIQIVPNLDSSSEEYATEKEKKETSRANDILEHYEGLSVSKKRGNQFNMEDLDVLDLSQIGESVGDQLGLFERKKRQQRDKNKNKNKVRDEDKDGGGDYDVLGLEDIGDTVGHELGLFNNDKKRNKNKKPKAPGSKKEDDYDMLGLDAIGESLTLERSAKQNKRHRRRQNKMMRGDWSQV